MDARAAAEAIFREESGRILATLIRQSGSFDWAEEAMQEAFSVALATWPQTGVPQNPAAWVTTTARRKLIDESRRVRTRQEKQVSLGYETPAFSAPNDAADEKTEMDFVDDRLRLMFTCCHPAIQQDAQVALTLRTLGGLTTAEIAKAFLLPEATLAQRLVRAKRKIHEARIPYVVPPARQLHERLASVQAVIYLIFNEGYTAASGDQLVRLDLCGEAIRLGRILCELLPDEPENLGLLALMILHHSRRDARTRANELVTLEEQDRSLWHEAELNEGLLLVEQGLKRGPVGPYQLQAAVAALHAEAKRAANTDWRQIAALYERLLAMNGSAVVALNHAVAVAMGSGWEEGLKRIEALTGELEQYYLFHAARADILRRMGRTAEARCAYERALALAKNAVEQAFLRRRMEQLG